jgi:hypothetical protein
MAVNRTDGGSFLTTFTDSSTGHTWRVNSSTDDKRVFSITVTFTKGTGTDSANYTESAKKALHDAIVNVINNNVTSSTYSSMDDVGMGHGI